MKEKNAFDPKQ